MGKYYRNIDYSANIAKLRRCFSSYCLELQLVWLAELLILHYYLKLKDTPNEYIRQFADYDILILRFIIRMLEKDEKPSDTYRKLVSFRNTYVHVGSFEAYNIFKELYCDYQLELIELARIVGVNLNFNCVLYRILERRKF